MPLELNSGHIVIVFVINIFYLMYNHVYLTFKRFTSLHYISMYKNVTYLYLFDNWLHSSLRQCCRKCSWKNKLFNLYQSGIPDQKDINRFFYFEQQTSVINIFYALYWITNKYTSYKFWGMLIKKALFGASIIYRRYTCSWQTLYHSKRNSETV